MKLPKDLKNLNLTKEEFESLTEEEQKMVDAFAEKIDVENTNQILQYGAGTQKKIAFPLLE